MASVANLKSGTHSARWSNWVVLLVARDDGWRAKVWRWAPHNSVTSRTEIGADDGFPSAREAAHWACERMRQDGAIVLVLDAPQFRLEDVLDFTPAPALVDEQ